VAMIAAVAERLATQSVRSYGRVRIGARLRP
jgi:hypothetical protein